MKKITSFILSLALICTVIFPAIKFVSSAASEEEIAQAVEAVKTAWNNVEGEKVQLNFTKFEINSGTYAIPGDENNKVTYTEQVPEDIAADEFGAGYYTVYITEPAKYFRKDAFHFSVPSTASVKISDIAEISYWYQCETTVSDRAPTSLIVLNPNGGNVGAKYVQTLPWNNSWHCNVINFSQELDWSDYNNASMSLTNIAICPSYGNKGTNVNIGGVALKLKPQIPDLDSMSELDILREYYKTDFSKNGNTEPLADAIAALRAALGSEAEEALATDLVKTAWNNVKGERIPLNFAYYAKDEEAKPAEIYTVTVGDGNSSLSYVNSVPDLPDTITAEEFGEGYHKINVDKSAIFYTKSAIRYSYPDTLTSNGITIGDIDSIDFCYKMDKLANYGNKYFEIGFNHRGIWFVDARRQTAVIDNNTDWNHMVYKIDATANWKDASWKDKPGNAIDSSTVASTALKKDQYFYISLGNNIVSTNFYIGGVFLQLKPQIPDISSMSALDIIKTYYTTDFSKYTNTEPLAMAITNLRAVLDEEEVSAALTEIEITKLKAAYNTLSLKGSNEVWASTYKDDNKVAVTVPNNTTTPEGITTEQLGSRWRTFNIDCTHDFTWGSCQIQFNPSTSNKPKAAKVTDGVLYYRVTDYDTSTAAPAIKATPTIDPPGGWKTSSPNKSVTLNTDGNWHSVRISDFFTAEDWHTTLPDGWESTDLVAIYLHHNATTAKIDYGSFAIYEQIDMPNGCDNWTLSDWVKYCEALDLSTALDTAEFTAALANAKAYLAENYVERYHEVESYSSLRNLSLPTDNLLSADAPTIVFNNGVNNVKSAKDYALLSDGEFNKKFTVNGSAPVNNANECYLDMYYDFSGKVDFDNISVVFPDDQVNTLKYEIFVSNDQDSLFETTNKILAFDNSIRRSAAQAQYFTFAKNVSGMYFGVRFYLDSNYAAANGDSYDFSLLELGVYGKKTMYTLEKGAFSNDKMKSYGENLLAKSDVEYGYYPDGGKVNKVKNINGVLYYSHHWSHPEWNRLVSDIIDSDSDTLSQLGPTWNLANYKDDGTTDRSCELVFDLKQTYSISTVFLNSWDAEEFMTGEYEVYVATNFDELFLSKNRVVSYDNRKGSEEGTTRSQAFNFLSPVVGKYVAVRVTNPLADKDKLIDNGRFDGNAYPRICDLGAFGEVYNKPLAEVNLLEHVITDVYRTDASGNSTPVSDTDYTAEEHMMVYDGVLDEAATIPTNSKQIDYVFNLAAQMKLNKLTFRTLSAQIKEIKFYAADIESDVWKDESIVYHYKQSSPAAYFEKDFGDGGLEARYVRYSIVTVSGAELQVAEIEALGWNTQEFNYSNIIQEKSDNISYYLQDKTTYRYTQFSPRANCHEISWNPYKTRPVKNMVDGNISTVTDLYNGVQNQKSINLLIDLEDLKAIDSITFAAGSSEDYWPTKLNFYFSRSDTEMFAKTATPNKAFTSKTEDGKYVYNFLPQYARYVRIEVLESNPKYYQAENMILTVISELRVDGLQIKADNGDYVASFKDPKTGVTVDILKNTNNDVYEKVQGIEVTERAATLDERKFLADIDMSYGSNIYDIKLLDADGKYVDEVDGRSVRIGLPVDSPENKYVIGLFEGEWGLFETTSSDNYIYATVDDIMELTFAVANIGAEEFDEDFDFEDEYYEDEYYEDEYYEDEYYDDEYYDEYEEEEEEEEFENTSSKKKIIRKRLAGNDNLWLIITLSVAGAVVVAGGVVLTILIIKKKKGDK